MVSAVHYPLLNYLVSEVASGKGKTEDIDVLKEQTIANYRRTRRSTEGNLSFGDIPEATGNGYKSNDIPENTRKSGYKTLEEARDKTKHKPKREKPTDDSNDLQKVLDVRRGLYPRVPYPSVPLIGRPKGYPTL